MLILASEQPVQISPIYTALIAAGSAILGIILKDFLFRIWERNRDKSESLDAIYSRYGEPLSSASTSLMWRLREIFEQPVRAGFLKIDICKPAVNKYAVFATYKKVSTLYRLAVLLGWVRACRRDFSSLRVADAKRATPVEQAFYHLESALADGPLVELERIRGLADLWNIQLPDDPQTLSSLGIAVETTIDSTMLHLNADPVELVSDEGRKILLGAVARAMTTGISVQAVDDNVLAERASLAMKMIGIREAWIYRDWQSAIGDLVLRPAENAPRRYDVIGFSEFDTLCISGTEDQRKWVDRLSAVFDDVDIAVRDSYDHRFDQLRELLKATAALTVALSDCVQDCNLSAETLSVARRLAS